MQVQVQNTNSNSNINLNADSNSKVIKKALKGGPIDFCSEKRNAHFFNLCWSSSVAGKV
jgi:hypothetical protein